jgi:AcrR family transcriptional regulator
MARTGRTPHRPLGRPPDADSAGTRAALLAAARAMFAEHGYAATSNKAIAEAAGVTAGSIYHYFPSKADLYIAVFLELQDRFEQHFQDAVRRHDDFVSRYCALLDDAAALNREDPTLTAFFVASPAEIRHHGELRDRLADVRMRRDDWLRRLAHDGIARGEMGPQIEVRALEDLLGVVFSGLASFAHLTGDPDRHEAAIGVLKEFLYGQLLSWQAASVAS